MPPPSTRPVNDIVDRIDAIAQNDCLSVRDVVRAFGGTSFLPVLMVPALLVVSPLSGIPLFSTVCGLSIAFISAQMVMRRRHLWLPDIFMRLQIRGARARQATRHLRRVARWLDDHTRDRFHPLTRRPFREAVQILCFLCGAAMPFLEIVPFSSSILGAAVLCLATALLARDGLLLLLGALAVLGAVLVPLNVLQAL